MAESYYIFDKRCTGDVFTEADAELAAVVVRGLTGFQLSMLLSHGIGLARSPLTATERRVVQFLLTSKLEKQIAAELGQSREIAEAAKIPDSVWSMDARAGAVTEALEAGAEKTDVQRAATHSSAAMTERYDRKSEAASLAVAEARRKARTGRE